MSLAKAPGLGRGAGTCNRDAGLVNPQTWEGLSPSPSLEDPGELRLEQCARVPLTPHLGTVLAETGQPGGVCMREVGLG